MSRRLDIDSFRARHAGWLDRFPEGVLYSLPGPIIDRLAQPGPRRVALLDGPAELAERDLLDLCRQAKAVGLDGTRAIEYPNLSPPLPPPTLPLQTREEMTGLGWSDEHFRILDTMVPTLASEYERLAAYAGWLSTEPPFLDAVRDLALRWRGLPDELRPGFPLLRPTGVGRALEGSSGAPETLQAWAADFTELCDRWGLVGMATWDLPSPQGPHLPTLVPMNSPALPARSVCLILPVHHHLTGDHGLMATILEQQRELARQLGLDPSVAGLPHYKQYAQILRVVHHERTITQRYAPGRRPRGFVDTLIVALADGLRLSLDQVKRHRKSIARCRAGRRSQVKRLRPPKR